MFRAIELLQPMIESHFSPNDFFAPFTVQSLNRDFKQGVDAIYAELQMGELSTLSLMLVNNQGENLKTSSAFRFESALDLPYTGKPYLAVSVNYQFTPLLLANLSIIRSMHDQSQLNTTYINYSLSDESTLNASVLLPTGENTAEFGLYPKVYALDYQIYF